MNKKPEKNYKKYSSVLNSMTQDKYKIRKCRRKNKKIHNFSEKDDDKIVLCDKVNDNYLNVNTNIIYNSHNENEEKSDNYYKSTQQKIEDLVVKKTKTDEQENPKNTDKNDCIEWFNNYKNKIVLESVCDMS